MWLTYRTGSFIARVLSRNGQERVIMTRESVLLGSTDVQSHQVKSMEGRRSVAHQGCE